MKTPGFLIFCQWVVGFFQNLGFLLKNPGFLRVLVDFVFLLYLTNIGLRSEFIQAITKSNYSLKTRKQLSATYKPNLKHIDHKNIGMPCISKNLILHHSS